MKYLLFAVMMVWGVNCFGQVKVYTTIDNITGDTAIETKQYPLVVEHYSKKDSVVSYSASASMYKIRGNKNFSLTISFNVSDAISLSEGGSGYIKISTGDIIQLRRIGGFKIYTKDDDIFYTLDITEAIDKLKNVEITDIRLTTDNGDRNISLQDHKTVVSQLIATLLTLNF